MKGSSFVFFVVPAMFICLLKASPSTSAEDPNPFEYLRGWASNMESLRSYKVLIEGSESAVVPHQGLRETISTRLLIVTPENAIVLERIDKNVDETAELSIGARGVSGRSGWSFDNVHGKRRLAPSSTPRQLAKLQIPDIRLVGCMPILTGDVLIEPFSRYIEKRFSLVSPGDAAWINDEVIRISLMHENGISATYHDWTFDTVHFVPLSMTQKYGTPKSTRLAVLHAERFEWQMQGAIQVPISVVGERGRLHREEGKLTHYEELYEFSLNWLSINEEIDDSLFELQEYGSIEAISRKLEEAKQQAASVAGAK